MYDIHVYTKTNTYRYIEKLISNVTMREFQRRMNLLNGLNLSDITIIVIRKLWDRAIYMDLYGMSKTLAHGSIYDKTNPMVSLTNFQVEVEKVRSGSNLSDLTLYEDNTSYSEFSRSMSINQQLDRYQTLKPDIASIFYTSPPEVPGLTWLNQ